MRGVMVGLLADEVGLMVQQGELVPSRRGLVLEHHRSSWPASEYRSTQPQRIDLDVEHDRIVGRVVHLEQRTGSGLWLVAVVERLEALPEVERWYLSPNVTGTSEARSAVARAIEIRSVALTTRPATNGARHVTVLPGELRDVARRPRQLLGAHAEILGRAAANRAGTSEIIDLRRSTRLAQRDHQPPAVQSRRNSTVVCTGCPTCRPAVRSA